MEKVTETKFYKGLSLEEKITYIKMHKEDRAKKFDIALADFENAKDDFEEVALELVKLLGEQK